VRGQNLNPFSAAQTNEIADVEREWPRQVSLAILSLAVITYVPEISLWLPKQLYPGVREAEIENLVVYGIPPLLITGPTPNVSGPVGHVLADGRLSHGKAELGDLILDVSGKTVNTPAEVRQSRA
jgi:hypothetical protein